MAYVDWLGFYHEGLTAALCISDYEYELSCLFASLHVLCCEYERVYPRLALPKYQKFKKKKKGKRKDVD